MEAFSLLKYWRVGTGSNGVNNKTTEKQQQQQQPVTTTIATTVSEMSVEEEAEECVVDGDADDEGPFFDLEFAVPDEDEDNNDGDEDKDDADDGDSVTTDEDDEDGFDFTVSPGSVSSGGNQIDSSSSPNNLTFSPSDDIFFKGEGGKSVSPLFQSSSSTTSSSSSSVENSNPKVQFPVSLIKTATKIRVFMLGFKSNNSSSNPKPKSEEQKPEQKQSTIRTELKQSKKFVTVKFRVDELLPMISLFTRDSSSSSAANSNNKITASSHEEIEVEDEEGKKLVSKDVVQKYLKMIKPLYVRVSKRYNNNGGGAFSPSRSMDNSSLIPPSPLPVKIEDEISLKRKQGVGNLPNGFRIVRKHLGKSRSASSVNPVTTNSSGGIQAKRRDDSLLQQQDGIQSAILHCKRSFNSSRDTDSCPRSSTESHEISIDSTRTSIDEGAAGK